MFLLLDQVGKSQDKLTPLCVQGGPLSDGCFVDLLGGAEVDSVGGVEALQGGLGHLDAPNALDDDYPLSEGEGCPLLKQFRLL